MIDLLKLYASYLAGVAVSFVVIVALATLLSRCGPDCDGFVKIQTVVNHEVPVGSFYSSWQLLDAASDS